MHKFIIPFLIILFAVFLVGTVDAQEQKPQQESKAQAFPCPQFSMQLQSPQEINEGQPVTFTINLGGGDPRVAPAILWSVSAGTISQGQATRTIVVDSTGAGSTPEREIRADVWVGGYASECVLQASASVRVIPPAKKFGDFGVVPDETITRNLKGLANVLTRSPDNLWLIVYAGRNSERGFASNWLKRLQAELVANGIASRRIQGIDGGYREQPLFDFWIVPMGANPPRPSPTIDRREIVFPTSPPPKKT